MNKYELGDKATLRDIITCLERLLEPEEKKPDDIVISFKDRSEYEAFYRMLQLSMHISTIVCNECCIGKEYIGGINYDSMKDWLDRTKYEIDHKGCK